MKKIAGLLVMSFFGIVLLNVNLNAQGTYNYENCTDNVGTHHYSKVTQMDEGLLYNRTHLPKYNHNAHSVENYNHVNLNNVATNLVDTNSTVNNKEVHNIEDCVDQTHNHGIKNENHDINNCTDTTHEHYTGSGGQHNQNGHKQNQGHVRTKSKMHH